MGNVNILCNIIAPLSINPSAGWNRWALPYQIVTAGLRKPFPKLDRHISVHPAFHCHTNRLTLKNLIVGLMRNSSPTITPLAYFATAVPLRPIDSSPALKLLRALCPHRRNPKGFLFSRSPVNPICQYRVVGFAFVSLPPALWQIAWTLLITNYEFSFHSCSHAEGFRHFPPPSTNENWKLAFNTYSLNLITL